MASDVRQERDAEIGRNYSPDLGVLADARTFLAQLLGELSRRALTLGELATHSATLEDVFVESVTAPDVVSARRGLEERR